MGKTIDKTVKSTQEQAAAAWINQLNQRRLDTLIERLNEQDNNLESALKDLGDLKRFINEPSHILGNELSKHGEIAEHMQVNISNARNAIQGLAKDHTFNGVGRTAPEDYLRAGRQVQMKFCNGLRQSFFSNNGVAHHLSTYPDFVKNGGAYDIPKDQYENMICLLDKYKNSPSKLSRSDYTLAKKLDEFFKLNDLVPGKDITPSVADYSEAQRNAVEDVINKEKSSLKKDNARQRKEAYDASCPSLKEGAVATGISAALEGGVTFCISVAQKRREKEFSEFTKADWKDIGLNTGKGTIKGGIRGAAIYTLTNFTATPACVASAYVTAVYGVVGQLKALEAGKVSKEDFIINCETVCLEASVSAISSLAGQMIIPIPVLGAVIGNIAGEFVYGICKKYGSKKALKYLEEHNQRLIKLDQQLDKKYRQVVTDIRESLKRFDDLEKLAFSEDVNIAFFGSIDLAKEVGVNVKLILHTKDQIDEYFLR